jgi:hypothetical protein
MGATLTVSIPGGRWVDGVRYRDVELRPLPARDEVLLSDPEGHLAGASTAARLTWLLARCVVRLGPLAPVDEESVRDLSVGDREALALHLRRLLVGERMACSLSCPDCREPLDLELLVGELLVPAYPDAGPSFETTVADGDASWRVRFRLPTGRDQEEVGGLADDAPEMGADEILRRCILAVTGDGVSPAAGLPEGIAARLPGSMAELDPQALLDLDMRCPSCGTAFVVPFSPSAFLVRELVDRSRRLIAEVHTLALSYHWSESAILALPARRRHAYLELIDRSVPVGAVS